MTLETVRTNITLIRRIVRNKNLITENISVRSTNNLTCALMFVDGIANAKLINEIRRRIRNINTDIISSDGMLEQLIEDKPFTLFPQVLSTERPDRAASFLLEGQVILASEGSPFVFAVVCSLATCICLGYSGNPPVYLAARWAFLRASPSFGLSSGQPATGTGLRRTSDCTYLPPRWPYLRLFRKSPR